MAIPYTQRVVKLGNSLAVILPSYITRELGIKRGTPVVVGCVEPDGVRIRILTDEDMRKLRVFDIQT